VGLLKSKFIPVEQNAALHPFESNSRNTKSKDTKFDE